jgi:hypothetical protein
MNRSIVLPVKVLAGTFIVALSAMPQYTISARPGVINSIEGIAYVNGVHVNDAKAAQRMFLNANDTLSTDTGKAEVLLTPGVYLRVADHSEIRMISPSLTDTQLKVVKGEAMIEAMDLLKENSVQVKVGDSNTQLEKIGLYRFNASNPPSVAVFEGKANVELAGKTVGLGKDHVAALDANLRVEKFKGKDDHSDDLYAWSKTRDEYDSASSYAASKSVATDTFSSGGWGGYGFSGFSGYAGPGWFYNPAFSSYAWLPGDGAFFSPFGYGFYAPGFVGYAPVVYSPVGGVVGGGGVAVPVNPSHLPAGVSAPAYHGSSLTAAARSASAIVSGVGAGGGHISSAMAMARSGGNPSVGSAGSRGGYSGSSAGSGSGSGFSGRGMSGGSSAGHAGGGGGGGGHR